MGKNADNLLAILETLVAYPSLTPSDAGCQAFMLDFLQNLGFHCQSFDCPPVANFYAEFGQGERLIVFAGHTDVVPVGDLSLWHTHPFELTQKKDLVYGRGVADMKGSLAAMLQAASRWVAHHPNGKQGRLGFLITSGEEGDDYACGTPYVMEELQKQGVQIDYCIVGEPSSTQKVGDVIKIGRRGSLSGKLRIQGKQGHVAYPHLAKNPIHMLAPVLAELTNKIWDTGTEHFPPTSFQITHIHSGGEASNIIPQEIILHFNFRFSPIHTAEHLQTQILNCFAHYDLEPSIEWILSGHPFLTETGALLEACKKIIPKHTDQAPECSTSGGTSDGRFIAPYGVEVIELGPVNSTIHQINECVSLPDLEILSEMYYDIICEVFK